MANSGEPFSHPHDTPVSSGLRFLTELIAWVAGPWAASRVSGWLIVPVLLILVALPAIFSTPGDKNTVIVPTRGSARLGLEALLFAVASLAPWLIWSAPIAAACTAIVIAATVTGLPRFHWLSRGAPSTD